MSNEIFENMLTWTEEQLLGLAPDTFTIRAARGLAKSEKWCNSGRNRYGAWGELDNAGNKPPFQTMLLFDDMTLWCTCQTTKSPCRHGLSLLLLLVNQPDIFGETAPSAPLRASVSPPPWFTAKQKRHQQQTRHSTPTQSNNLDLLHSGMNELDLWLKDLIRNGLADLPGRPTQYWTAMADRMVDAEAPLISHTLRSLAKVPVEQKNWPEQYLRQLGQLYLITQGFKHWDSQLPATQADLKTAVGRLPSQPGELELTDDWLVLGNGQEVFGRLRQKFTWLWGVHNNRPATLLQRIAPGGPTTFHFPTGTCLQGTLQFAHGNWPTFGLLPAPLAITNEKVKYEQIGYATIQDAVNVYTDSKAATPWQTSFPMLLSRVKPLVSEDGLHLVDQNGMVLPMVNPLSCGWHLEAFSNGRFLTLFGTWNGTTFDPVSVEVNHNWLDLHILQGVR